MLVILLPKCILELYESNNFIYLHTVLTYLLLFV
uniref:Uncharacterized protein n=1 Tax=Anguilla anguilla TaxID=7936 RepID=A0A0E9QIZ5_ANGAN